jgi:pyruvyltransferase
MSHDGAGPGAPAQPVVSGPDGVQTFSWNPHRRPTTGLARRWRRPRPVNNFGDLLGPLVVRAVAVRLGLDLSRPSRSATLMSIGSVLHLAPPGAVVWGSGINGKMATDGATLRTLDVRAVRGPLTRDRLAAEGVEAPPVYGDPAILLGELRPDLVGRTPRHAVTVIPNLNDAPTSPRPFTDPRRPVEEVLTRIAESELVVGSSLHGIIVAEALGVPARLVLSQHENPLKYDDYYAGTQRDAYTPAADVAEAVRMGGEALPELATAPLLAAFPTELWRRADR